MKNIPDWWSIQERRYAASADREGVCEKRVAAVKGDPTTVPPGSKIALFWKGGTWEDEIIEKYADVSCKCVPKYSFS